MVGSALVHRHTAQYAISKFLRSFYINTFVYAVAYADLGTDRPAIDLPPVVAVKAADALAFGANFIVVCEDGVVRMRQQYARAQATNELQLARLLLGAMQMVEPHRIDHKVVKTVVQSVIENR